MSKELQNFRRQIDRLDDEIIALLAKRFGVIQQVAELKARQALPARIPERIEEVVQRNVASAKAKGLNPQLIENLYRAIIEEACRVEEERLKL